MGEKQWRQKTANTRKTPKIHEKGPKTVKIINIEIFVIMYFSRMEFKSLKSRKIDARKNKFYSILFCQLQRCADSLSLKYFFSFLIPFFKLFFLQKMVAVLDDDKNWNFEEMEPDVEKTPIKKYVIDGEKSNLLITWNGGYK